MPNSRAQWQNYIFSLRFQRGGVCLQISSLLVNDSRSKPNFSISRKNCLGRIHILRDVIFHDVLPLRLPLCRAKTIQQYVVHNKTAGTTPPPPPLISRYIICGCSLSMINLISLKGFFKFFPFIKPNHIFLYKNSSKTRKNGSRHFS